MANHVHSQEGNGGENDVQLPSPSQSSTSKPTLKEFISNQLGKNSDRVYNKLSTEMGIHDIDLLIFSDENDIIQLCQSLDLSFVQKMKFKAGIRKLKISFQPQQPQSIVTISPKEQAMIDKIKTAIKRCSDLQNIFEHHFNSIEDHLAVKKSEIHTKINDAIKALQNREKSLYQQVTFINKYTKNRIF